MDSLWIVLGVLAALALAVAVWRIKARRAALQALGTFYARRQGLLVELLKVAESSKSETARALTTLAALEQRLSTAETPERAAIEAEITCALNELYALADGDDDLMANHAYVLIQARLVELARRSGQPQQESQGR